MNPDRFTSQVGRSATTESRCFDPAGSPLCVTAIGTTRSRHHGRARYQDQPHRRHEHMESRMQRKLHVRFGGWAGETHQSKDSQGAPVRPLRGCAHLSDHDHRGRCGCGAVVRRLRLMYQSAYSYSECCIWDGPVSVYDGTTPALHLTFPPLHGTRMRPERRVGGWRTRRKGSNRGFVTSSVPSPGTPPPIIRCPARHSRTTL